MNIGIVGGNSKVATEVSLYLRDAGYTVYPIVRNKLSAAFLASQGFSYRVAEVYNADDCDSLFDDLDMVIIAAHARPYTRGYISTSEARQMNEDLVKNTMRYSPANASVIYFSSIAAHGGQYSGNKRYTQEKNHAEEIVRSEAENENKSWYALRLGHVLGANASGFFENVIKDSKDGEKLILQTNPDDPSNTVHPEVISGVIADIIEHDIQSGIYDVVNQPQWSWDDVFTYIFPEEGATVVYTGPPSTREVRSVFPSPKKSILKLGWKLAGPTGDTPFWTLYRYLPDTIEKKAIALRNVYSTKSISTAGHTSENVYWPKIMNNDPISERLFPRIPELSPDEIDDKRHLRFQHQQITE